MIEVSALEKRFGRISALGGVSFKAPLGQITGLLGPNGAGKSTCLRILSTVMQADRGRAEIAGRDVADESLEVRKLIGVLPHGAGLYPQLTARENIRYYGELHGIAAPALDRRIAELLGLARSAGHIGFLGHGSEVEFRRIELKDLTRSER